MYDLVGLSEGQNSAQLFIIRLVSGKLSSVSMFMR